jgi:hypothetical protein
MGEKHIGEATGSVRAFRDKVTYGYVTHKRKLYLIFHIERKSCLKLAVKRISNYEHL